jgi:hypothetical protein
MTDAKKKERILGYLKYWAAAFGLQNWELDIIWRKTNGCEVRNNTPYKSAKIYFDITIEEAEWDSYALHEVLHIFLAEQRYWLKWVRDRITEQELKMFTNIEEGIVNSLMVIILQGRLQPNAEV